MTPSLCGSRAGALGHVLTRPLQRVPDMLDRIISGVEPGEWGSAAEKQLCFEIKACWARGGLEGMARHDSYRRHSCWLATRPPQPC